MKCEEFRKRLNSAHQSTFSEQDEKALESHLNECKTCNTWLDNLLLTSPDGIKELSLLNAPQKCFPESIIKKENVVINENKSLLSTYLSGLKYGLVFGLSIICGLAIVEMRNESKQNAFNNSPQIPPFIVFESSIKDIPSFINESSYANLNFFENQKSEISDFYSLDSSEDLNFYQINLEEENYDG
ncbi:MAG: hypothetical protein PHF29_00595 [Candidatus Riflebacteria bacterium]|nr:hypothetical protein [Candidatus Riflebacteria bacterium]